MIEGSSGEIWTLGEISMALPLTHCPQCADWQQNPC